MPLDQLEQLVLSKAEQVSRAASAGAPDAASAPAPSEPPMDPDGIIDAGLSEAGFPAMTADPAMVSAATGALVKLGLLAAPSESLTEQVLQALAAWAESQGMPLDINNRQAVMAVMQEVASGA